VDIFCRTITDILYVIEILSVCKLYLGLKERKEDKYRYVKVFILSVSTSLFIYQIEDSIIAFVIHVLCIEGIVFICYSEYMKKIAIYALWVLIVVEMVNMLSTLMINTIGNVMKCNNTFVENLVAVLLALCIIYIVSIFLRKMPENAIRHIEIRYMIGFTIILLADVMVLSLMASVTLEEMAHKNRVLYIIAYTSVGIGIFIQLTAVILLLISRNMYREKEQIIKKYLEEQIKYYEYLRDKERETKKFRHDIRGHLYFLNRLKKEGKDREFELYFQDVVGRVDELGSSVNVGNDIVNALLSKAYVEAKKKSISMTVTGSFPGKCNVSAYHLCTIFFNLLNNAIEAADNARKREVWVVCQYTTKEIIVEIGNYFCEEKHLDKENLKTIKSEKEYHGWGMNNVKDSIEKCKGLIDIDIKKDKFVVSIILDNKGEEEDKSE